MEVSMKTFDIVNGPKNVSAIIQGCMRMPSLSKEDAAEVIRTAYDCGVNFFDHATCYGMGEAETRFSEAFPLTGLKREDIYIQSKCGICPDRQEFDWTKENILTSVDGILERLKVDYLDTLLLHRPDMLFDPEDVAEAFDILEQTELLKKYVKQPLIINQVQLSLEQSQLIDQALYMNNKTTDMSINRDGNALDYCRLNDITIQAWSPLQVGMFGGSFIDNPDFPELNKVLGELAEREGVTKAAIAIAWILRHPAKMQAIIGSMSPVHIKEACAAADVKLSHHDWYQLYLAAGKFLP